MSMVTSCGISLSSQVGFYGLLRNTNGTGELNLGDVEGVKTRDIGLISGRNRFLRLHDFDIVGDSGCEAVLRFAEGLAGEFSIALGHAHEIRGGSEVQQ